MKATDIFAKIEEGWKYVAYDPKRNKIYLLSAAYKCLDTEDVWFDYQDGEKRKKVRHFNKRIRTRKTKHWIYLGPK